MRVLLVAWILAVCSGCQPGQTVLKGHIENYQGEQLTIQCYELNIQDTLQVDASGNFSWTTSGTDCQIYAIRIADYQPWRIPVYLTPGDQEELKLSFLPDKTIKVKYAGDRVAENEYRLAFDKLEGLMFGYTPESRKLSFVDYNTQLEQMEREMQPLLKRITDTEIKPRWTQKQYLWFQSKRMMYAGILASQLWKGNQVSDEDFNTFVKSLDVNDPKECNEDMIGNIINWQQAQESSFQTEERQIDYLNRLNRLVSNQERKNEFATQHLKEIIKGASGRSLDKEIARYNEICTDDTMRNQVNEQYKEYVKAYDNLTPGKPAPDFELIDVKGKKCRLSDLKGTYLFIDVWATWCGWCIKETPYMEKLQEHFANDKRITLISISWDYTQKVWLDYLKKHPATWPQYMVDKKNMEVMRKEYRMSGIPRFILIDPQGRLVSYDYERPSQPECVKKLEQDMENDKNR